MSRKDMLSSTKVTEKLRNLLADGILEHFKDHEVVNEEDLSSDDNSILVINLKHFESDRQNQRIRYLYL